MPYGGGALLFRVYPCRGGPSGAEQWLVEGSREKLRISLETILQAFFLFALHAAQQQRKGRARKRRSTIDRGSPSFF